MLKQIKAFYEKSEKFFHPLVGLSSYEKYLEHMKRNHPDKKVLSRGEFFNEALDRRYNSGGFKKCC
ncbi:KCU-star family selenoprotein [Aliarcobacter vitoriensis]|uniref:DUF466 domain-containing protein n=1 Tax=Aliarcobacter vitoriensis TaxID=2011099 RepID=A0A366MW20_9BACT|nr:KCU-star family selenoprotein [Aliarcobacter vitoriensis]RBQ29679.1 hypothetical protein CRU91_03520 [Aliarcobacter vitoriensis]RBQ30600.1 hypothetical protein CRU92_11285 [Arcobacter sp. FW59]